MKNSRGPTPLFFRHLACVAPAQSTRASHPWGSAVGNYRTNLLTIFPKAPMLETQEAEGPESRIPSLPDEPMQLNVRRLKYHLAAALSEYADTPPPHPITERSTPKPPKGELKRPLQTRLTVLQHDQVRWIAPRLNMTMADFARRSIEAMIEHIVEDNPHILFDDYPAHGAPPSESAEDPQLDLFAPAAPFRVLISRPTDDRDDDEEDAEKQRE